MEVGVHVGLEEHRYDIDAFRRNADSKLPLVYSLVCHTLDTLSGYTRKAMVLLRMTLRLVYMNCQRRADEEQRPISHATVR